MFDLNSGLRFSGHVNDFLAWIAERDDPTGCDSEPEHQQTRCAKNPYSPSQMAFRRFWRLFDHELCCTVLPGRQIAHRYATDKWHRDIDLDFREVDCLGMVGHRRYLARLLTSLQTLAGEALGGSNDVGSDR